MGGKGGVGKTTCAAAWALSLAAAGRRVLVVSTDPAPSLSDAFDVRLTRSPRRIERAGGDLFGVEIDASTSLRRWIDRNRAVLESIAVHGTWLDRDDVSNLLQLSLPGIDELAALFEIADISRSARFDEVVVDTAPTGHTMRMLTMPETLFGLARVFDRMREKQRVVEEVLRGRSSAGVEDDLITELASTARHLTRLLRAPDLTQITLVTLAEPLAIAETHDALRTLRGAGMHVDTLVVNQLTSAPDMPCGHCDARIRFERASLRQLPEVPAVRLVSAKRTEPRGVRALTAIGRELVRRPPELLPVPRRRAWKARRPEGSPIVLPALVPAGIRLAMLGGKGGVGKTTCAAALAIAVASQRAGERVLLISVDPAHSLGDALTVRVTDSTGNVEGGPSNLFVRELDATAEFARLRERYVVAIDELFDRFSGGSSFDASYDRSVMRELIELAPPGLDELAAIIQVTDALSAGSSWDLVVMDTAPSGHALRLLEVPELIHGWVRAFMSILLKYRGVTPLGSLAAMLLELSKSIGRLRELLSDAERTAFLTVTRPAVLPRHETVRLVKKLSTLRMNTPWTIVNALGRGECKRCRRASLAQLNEIDLLREDLAPPMRPGIVFAPAEVPPPVGLRALERWGRRWRAALDAPS